MPTAAKKPPVDDTYTTDAGDYDEAIYDEYDEDTELPKVTTTSATVNSKIDHDFDFPIEN